MALTRWLSRVQNWQRCRQALWRWWHRHWHFNAAAVYVDCESLWNLRWPWPCQNHWVAKRVDPGFGTRFFAGWTPTYSRMVHYGVLPQLVELPQLELMKFRGCFCCDNLKCCSKQGRIPINDVWIDTFLAASFISLIAAKWDCALGHLFECHQLSLEMWHLQRVSHTLFYIASSLIRDIHTILSHKMMYIYIYTIY